VGKGRILIVEDEADLAWVEQFNLESEGYEVQVAPEGLTALRVLETFDPDVLVLDVMLPHVDGWAVLSRTQELPEDRRPKVIVVSAVAGVGDEMRARTLGVGSFLAKPFEMDELLRLVGEAVEAA
jgi:DNA-binding response OmpR family regulator